MSAKGRSLISPWALITCCQGTLESSFKALKGIADPPAVFGDTGELRDLSVGRDPACRDLFDCGIDLGVGACHS